MARFPAPAGGQTELMGLLRWWRERRRVREAERRGFEEQRRAEPEEPQPVPRETYLSQTRD